MEWFSLMSTDVLTSAAKLDLTQNLIVFGIMWSIIKRTIAKHFNNIEDSLKRIADGLDKHDERITKLESTIKKE